MEAYLFPIEAAMLSFLGIALAATFPYMLIQYRKYGSISKLRTMIIFSFCLYLLCAYYLVILPLPDPREFGASADIWHYINLIPFHFVFEIVSKSSLNITDIHTYLPALRQDVVFQPAFNILLTVPFGIYLGYYFRKNLKKTILMTFLLSLFFEISQLSGLFWVYPHPYRFFDVDDLMLNTLGGLIGFQLYRHFLSFLPSREKIDENNLKASEKVGYIRRLFAFSIDYAIVSLAATLIMSFIEAGPSMFNTIAFSIALFGYFALSQSLFGQTIGKALVRIKLLADRKDQSYRLSVVLRYAMMCSVVLLVKLLGFLVETVYASGIYVAIQLSVLMAVVADLVLSAKKGKILLYEKVSKTRNISTIFYVQSK